MSRRSPGFRITQKGCQTPPRATGGRRSGRGVSGRSGHSQTCASDQSLRPDHVSAKAPGADDQATRHRPHTCRHPDRFGYPEQVGDGAPRQARDPKMTGHADRDPKARTSPASRRSWPSATARRTRRSRDTPGRTADAHDRHPARFRPAECRAPWPPVQCASRPR